MHQFSELQPSVRAQACRIAENEFSNFPAVMEGIAEVGLLKKMQQFCAGLVCQLGSVPVFTMATINKVKDNWRNAVPDKRTSGPH
jgi:hypothetical protein